MSEIPGMTMEEAEEAEENELLGEEGGPSGSVTADDFDETAEDLMTDMKLEDEFDEVRVTEPDFPWLYHIEIYPWSADDVTENIVRLLKIADFSQMFLRKKGACKENGEQESLDDKLHDRQRKGSIHFYTNNFQNAKNIIRISIWKTMVSKQLTFEITRRGSDHNNYETAYLEVDTYTACKCRYRDKPKGEFKDRAAKVSGIPGNTSLEFLDVVFCRAHAVTGGSNVKEYYQDRGGKLQQKLSQIKDFDGSLNFDCLCRGSCRAFVTAHKNVYIGNQRVFINAINKETMVAPPSMTYGCSADKKDQEEAGAASEMSSQVQLLRASPPHPDVEGRGGMSAHAYQAGRGGLLREPVGSAMCSRGRGMGRSTILPQRPVSLTTARAGPGMPVPMTGRQKMNEKMRRGNVGLMSGPPTFGTMFNSQGGPLVPRNAVASIGESFKQEIASLQKQLQQNTAELEAKIGMLQESTNSALFFDANESDWDETGYGDEEDEYVDESFADVEGMGYVYPDIHNYLQSYGTAGSWGMVKKNRLGAERSNNGRASAPGMGGQRLMHTVTPADAQGLVSGPGMMTQSGLAQVPLSFPGHVSQSIIGPKFHSVQGQVFQNVPSHPPQQVMQGQMSQAFPVQMAQALHSHVSQAAEGQPALPVQMVQPVPQRLQQAVPGEMSHSYPQRLVKALPGGRMAAQSGNGPVTYNPHMQACSQRGGGSFQRLRGMMRGKGKMRGGMSGPPAW